MMIDEEVHAVKLYNSLGPNPRLVRMFLAEKRVDLPTVEIDIMAGENRREPYTDLNPAGQMPCLEYDEDRVLSETVAICEYLEEKYPDPPLIGVTPEQRAETRMWVFRVMLNVTEPLANGFRFAEGLAMFEQRLHVIPQAADDLKATARENLAWLDGQLEGRNYLCGNRLTLADIILYCLLDFGSGVGQPLDPALKNVDAWFQRMSARPSAEASLHPAAVAAGMRA
jgi:glutathione S-transferase